MESSPVVAVLSDDLIFSSRIAGAAQSFGARIRSARTVESMLTLANDNPLACVIVDLAVAGPRLGELLTALAALPTRPCVVGYGAHVNAAGLRNAALAGCDIVLPRSKFIEALDHELPQWLAPRT
jgi:hypothetical protein